MLVGDLERLSLDSADVHNSKPHSGTTLLGDGFHRLSALSCNELPKLLPPSIEIRVLSGEFTANEELLNFLPIPAAASPLLKTEMFNLQRLTTGDSKVVYHGNGLVVFRRVREGSDRSRQVRLVFGTLNVPSAHGWPIRLTLSASRRNGYKGQRVNGLYTATENRADLVHRGCENSTWSPLSITAGDSLAVLCQNSRRDVDWLLSRMDYVEVRDADSPFTVEAAPTGRTAQKVPAWLLPSQTVTVRFLLTYCCELHVPVTRRMLRILANCCCKESDDSKDQAECMLSFSSNQFRDLFDECIRQTNMTFMDLLATFPACRPTITSVLELLPFLRPRAYSLLDCCDTGPRRQHLSFAFTRVDFNSDVAVEKVVGLVRYPHRRHGVCSGWLEHLWTKSDCRAISVYLRKNLAGFQLPQNPKVPVIMVAAGTGIAPFVCFLRRRRMEATNGEQEVPGNQKVTEQKQNPSDLPLDLNSLTCCHWGSRYVQECVVKESEVSAEHQRRLAELLLEQNAVVFVCGENKHMVPAVREAFSSLLSTYLHCEDGSNSVGTKYVNEMKHEKRYIEELWV